MINQLIKKNTRIRNIRIRSTRSRSQVAIGSAILENTSKMTKNLKRRVKHLKNTKIGDIKEN